MKRFGHGLVEYEISGPSMVLGLTIGSLVYGLYDSDEDLKARIKGLITSSICEPNGPIKRSEGPGILY